MPVKEDNLGSYARWLYYCANTGEHVHNAYVRKHACAVCKCLYIACIGHCPLRLLFEGGSCFFACMI